MAVLPGLRQTSDGGPASPPYTADSYTWDITTLILTGSLTIQGNFTFGDAAADSFVLLGRMATGTIAGSFVDIDASTSTYPEGVELRYRMTDWADVATFTEFKGMYLRAENTEANASGDVYGLQVFGVTNAVQCNQLWGGFFYAYVKGSAAVTIGKMYAVQAELSWDAGGSQDTLSTEAICVRAKVTSGSVDAYTNIHGVQVKMGDMNAGSRTYGSAFWALDDADTSGTSTYTRGLYLQAACTTGVDIAGTVTTGILLSGTITTGINFTGTVTTGISFDSATLSPGSAGGVSSIAFDIGSRTTEQTVTFAGSTGVENFEPVQMKVNFIGANPESVSKVNMIYQQLTHGTTPMANLRLKCADFTITVKKNLQDAYVYQGEIAYTTNSVTVGGESAVMSLNMNCASTVTGNVRGLIVNMYGAGLANASSIGIEVRTDGGSATLDEGIRIWSVGANTITAGLLFAGTTTYFADFSNTAGAENTAYEKDGNAATTIEGKIMIKDSDGDKGYINVYSTAN